MKKNKKLVAGLILAGGKSRRMNFNDKTFMKIDNKGCVLLEVLQGQQSNKIKSFVEANCWGIFPQGKDKFKKGDIIQWVPLIPGS